MGFPLQTLYHQSISLSPETGREGAVGKERLCAAIETLREQFLTLDWTYHDFSVGSQAEKMYRWPGPAEEEILVLVHQSGGRQELFHRHDFFYFNYTYQGQYDSLSYKYDNRITIHEGELYAGQPFAGHALCVMTIRKQQSSGCSFSGRLFSVSFCLCCRQTPGFFIFYWIPLPINFQTSIFTSKLRTTATSGHYWK